MTKKSESKKSTEIATLKEGQVAVNKQEMMSFLQQIQSRSEFLQRAGKSYNDDRDIYKSLGYEKALEFRHFWEQYQRGDISKRIIEAPVTESWRLPPMILENDENKETKFEKQWKKLVKNKKVLNYLMRVDKLAGIGNFSLLLLGVNDGKTLDKPVSPNSVTDLLYLRPYKQDNITVESFEVRPSNPRFGLPEIYRLQTTITSISKGVQKTETITKRVHWSRVLHIAEGLLEDDVVGTPRLKAIFNQLKNLELVSCGSAEMFWRGALPGLAFLLDKDAILDSSLTEATMEDDIEKYMHNLQRVLKLQGMDVKVLAPEVADPSNHVDVYVSLIAGTTGIPKRILIGSERGELSSSQDESAWNKRLEERRDNHITPIILEPFVKRLQEFGLLKDVEFEIKWPPIAVPSEKERAEIAEIKTKAISGYFNALDAFDFIPLEIFLKEVLELPNELIGKILDMTKDVERTRINQPQGGKDGVEGAGGSGNPLRGDNNPKQAAEVGKKKGKGKTV